VAGSSGGTLRRLCPSCAQKRTLLVGEYLSEDLLLTLPHRQFVWTIPLGGPLQRPLGATAALTEIWRRRVVALFIEKGLLNHDFARNLLGWEHSEFSIESETRILDQPTREAPCQYE
jgi:hypothetical protein